MLLHFALVLHFAVILITFCVSITFCGDYYILRRNKLVGEISSRKVIKITITEKVDSQLKLS